MTIKHIYENEEWKEEKETYRKEKDCVRLLNYVGEILNFFCENVRDYRRVSNFTDNCPPEYVRTIISPNGRTDWSRAVWCLYTEVQKLGFTGKFTQDVLEEMEDWLKIEGYTQEELEENLVRKDPRLCENTDVVCKKGKFMSEKTCCFSRYAKLCSLSGPPSI